METNREVKQGAQVGQTDTPRIDSAETGYAAEWSDESDVLANFQEDAINAQADREDLEKWAEHDM